MAISVHPHSGHLFQGPVPGHGHGAVSSRPNLAAELRGLFAEREDDPRPHCAELLQRCAVADVPSCIGAILDRLVNFPAAHPLGLYALAELLRLQPAATCKCLGPSQVSHLFHQRVDESQAAHFLHTLLLCKEAQGIRLEEDGAKLVKFLLRRSKQQDLRRIPSSPLRAWLCQIWLDAPSSRPMADLMTACCARWVSDAGTSPAEKLPCLALLRQELERRGRPAGEAWLLSSLFEQVCRDPIHHSPDLQQLVWTLGAPPSPLVLKPLMSALAQEPGRLATLWLCLCLWPLQAPPEHTTGELSAVAWPTTTLPPLHAMMRALLVVFSQLPDSSDLCRTCILVLASLAANPSLQVASTSMDLLLLLHRDGPLLGADVWKPLVPLLEAQLSQVYPAAAELLERLWRASGHGQQAIHPPTGQHMSPDPMQHPEHMQPPEQMPYGVEHHQAEGYYQPHFSASQPFHQVLGGASQPGPSFESSPTAGFEFPHGGGGGGFGEPFHAPAQPAHQSFPQALPNFGFEATGFPTPSQSNSFHAQTGSGGDAAAGLPLEGTIEVSLTPPKVGLQNTNNTCYMNSFIQSLFMTNRFVWRLFSFQLKLKKNASKVDKEDFEFGVKLVKVLQRHMAKMMLTKHKHTDIWDVLQTFPDNYRNGEQQDVTETVRYVFDKLGSFEQPLIREVFAGELSEKVQCQVCGSVKDKPETFTDLVLTVPPEDQVLKSGSLPTAQALLDLRLRFETLDDENLLWCERCQQKQRAGKWCEIVSPPAHLCICLNRFTFDLQKMDFTKEKTPVRVDGILQIGPFTYELYMVIVHTGKTASSGHYYAIGKRSEGPEGGWYTMDDSQIKPADMSLLSGGQTDKLKDDNPYVLFYRCQQAPPTPQPRIPEELAQEVRQLDAKQEGS